jgi:hypothetical protein
MLKPLLVLLGMVALDLRHAEGRDRVKLIALGLLALAALAATIWWSSRSTSAAPG